MNDAEKLSKKRNRLSRCKKRLTIKEIPSDYRTKLSQRCSELDAELKSIIKREIYE